MHELGINSAKLLEIGCILDLPTSLPKSQLDDFVKNNNTNPLTLRILQRLVIKHIYMFKVAESDKQWLISKEILPSGANTNSSFKHLNKGLVKN